VYHRSFPPSPPSCLLRPDAAPARDPFLAGLLGAGQRSLRPLAFLLLLGRNALLPKLLAPRAVAFLRGESEGNNDGT